MTAFADLACVGLKLTIKLDGGGALSPFSKGKKMGFSPSSPGPDP